MNRQWMCNDCWHWFTLHCSAPLRLLDCERWLLSVSNAFCYADKEVYDRRICSRGAKRRRETDGSSGKQQALNIRELWGDTRWFSGSREWLRRQIPACPIKLSGNKRIQLIFICCSAKNCMLIQSKRAFFSSRLKSLRDPQCVKRMR